MLLPALEAGVFNEYWRIRQSSVLLLGDLLYRVGGTKALGGVEADEDDSGAGSTAVTEAILRALGKESRNSVFAALYMVRSDSSAVVRQSALQVWKSVVANTPRTLREILTSLMTKIIECLSSRNEDSRNVASKSLGDIVRKLGERVMPEVVPILQAGLEFEGEGDGNWETRQGVCLGLSEVIGCATNQQLEAYMQSLLACVQEALSDVHPSVREAAAQTFQTLTRKVGDVASNEILPTLLEDLEGDEHEFERALHGLKEILCVRPGQVLPTVVPVLLAQPITAAHARALGVVAEVTATTIHHYFKTILTELTKGLIDNDAAQV
jgi:HEAT repeat protein